jgi:hypothetical protein
MIQLRASKMPLVTQCPQSLVEPTLRVEGDDQAARLGTAVHAAVLGRIQTGETLRPSSMATIYGVRDVPELDRLMDLAWNAWLRVQDWFPEPETEVEYHVVNMTDDVKLTGHIDVLSVLSPTEETPGELRIADFKSGWADMDHTPQMLAYARLALAHNPTCTSVYTAVLRLRDGSIEGARYDLGEVLDWWDRTRQEIRENADAYRLGDHCRWCPRVLECPAQALALQNAAYMASSPYAPTSLVDAYDACKRVQKAAEFFLPQIKAQVAALGGRVDCGDGRELVLIDQVQQEIDFGAGCDVLSTYLAPEALDPCLSIRKGALEAAVKLTAPPRGKGRLWKECLGDLERAGALRAHFVTRLECRRKEKHGTEVEQTETQGKAEKAPGQDTGNDRSGLDSPGAARGLPDAGPG